MQYEHQRLFQVKNQFLEKPVPNGNNLYGNRELSNGNSNCTYSTEDGADGYFLILKNKKLLNSKFTFFFYNSLFLDQ